MDTSEMRTIENKEKFGTIFIFPFEYSLDENAAPADIAEKLCGDNNDNDKKKGWAIDFFNQKGVEKPPTENGYSPTDFSNYNQWKYFHPFVRKMIFSEKNTSESNEKNNQKGMTYLAREDYTEMKVQYYDIDWKTKEMSCVTLKPTINSIDLHLYENGVGVLSITSTFTNEQYRKQDLNLKKLLRFNDIARRIYPPHLGEVVNNGKLIDKENTSYPKKESMLLPQLVELIGEGAEPLYETYPHINLDSGKERISNIITTLLPESCIGKITSFTDDRMFIVSFLRDSALSSELVKVWSGYQNFEETADLWYQYMFVDGNGKAIANKTMQAELLRKHTYARWAEWGTLWGMTRYSLVGIFSEGAPDYLISHAKGIYYQMALIILFQKAMLQQFTERIRDMVRVIPNADNVTEEFLNKANNIQGDFIQFTTKYRFREVTPQEQGIEMYRQWVEIVQLDEMYETVKSEIDQFSEYVQTLIGHKTEEKIEKLTKVMYTLTWVLVLLTIILVLFGDDLWFKYLPETLHTLKWGWLVEPALFILGILTIIGITNLLWSQVDLSLKNPLKRKKKHHASP